MIKVKLKDVAEVKNGSTPSTTEKDNYDGDIIWITPKDLSDQKQRFVFHGERTITKKGYDSCSTTLIPVGSILLSSRAPIGLLAIAGVECCTNQGFKNLILNKEKINNKWLYYYLKLRINEIESLGGGTTFKEISKTSLENYEINLPLLSTQSAIARVLSSLDDKIELNNKINKELENLAKMIYEYWFVQNADKKWERKKIGNLLIKYTDNSLHINAGNVLKEGKYPVITQDVGDLIKGYTNEEKPIADLPAIVFGDHSCTLRYIKFPFFRGADGTQLLYFENEETIIYAYFCLLKMIPSLPNFGKYERHFKYLKDFEIDVPPTPILQKFNKAVSSIFSTIDKNRHENNYLAQLRDFLLPLLMNGQAAAGK